MYLAINGLEIVAYPAELTVKIVDIDAEGGTTRTADAQLTRDRIAVKRQLDMSFNALTWERLSSLLRSMSAPFFDFTYPDTMTGQQETKTFYVGDRSAPIAMMKNGVYWWRGLTLTLTEM
ncbi:MAG: hypothetical protein K6T85_02795 [Gorillibacterium sp.]|nr:hypothetical protein [Gorillibacterium sp.]